MAADPSAEPLLIVCGSTLRAEEADRPLAYYLKQRVEEVLRAMSGPSPEPFQVCVVADFRWIHDDPLHALPTISIGGPGVNALAHRWFEEIPISLAVDEQYYIQMDPDLDDPRASVWGMDNTTTQIAVSVFIERFLPRFLKHCIDGPSEPD